MTADVLTDEDVCDKPNCLICDGKPLDWGAARHQPDDPTL